MTSLKRRFIVFTCRDIKYDFRWPLAEALRARHETWYIYLRRRPRIFRPTASTFEEISFPSLLALLIRLTRTNVINIYLNTTNTSFPIIMPLMRLICGHGLWILDMHDDLLYDSTGIRHAQAAIAIKLQVWTADIIIRAAESLIELFPSSIGFGNASQVGPIERATIDYCSVLVLASLDQRFDFDFMAAVAKGSPSRTFEIYGQVSKNDKHINTCMAKLCNENANIVHHGAYGLADLESILSRYSVTLAPYRINYRLTRYIDPLRYYHCLNSGMELITTAIPQTDRLHRGLHVVRLAADVEPILIRLETEINFKRNTGANYSLQTWEKRAQELIQIAAEHPSPLVCSTSKSPGAQVFGDDTSEPDVPNYSSHKGQIGNV